MPVSSTLLPASPSPRLPCGIDVDEFGSTTTLPGDAPLVSEDDDSLVKHKFNHLGEPPVLATRTNRHPSDDDTIDSVQAFSDSDHAADIQTRRSQTGTIITLDGSVIDFLSHLQRTISMSSCEAELQAFTTTSKRVKYIRAIFKGLRFNVDKPTPTYTDNDACRLVASATGTTKRLRHVDLRHFAIQEWRSRGLILPLRVDTTTNPSDLLTKLTDSRAMHWRHTNRLMGYHGPLSVMPGSRAPIWSDD